MLRYHVAVCDDERFAADAIVAAADRALQANGAQADFEVFTSAAELARRVVQTSFDLILLDIEMPGVDGIELGGLLREHGVRTEIIYVSNAEGRVFESLQVRPLGFVRKSTFAQDMANAMGVFVRSRRKRDSGRTISLKMRHSLATFPVDDICYVEGRGRDKLLHMVGGRTEEVVATLDELAEKLEPYGFCRVHKGFLVNFAFAERIDAEGVHMGDELVPVSRTKVTEVRAAYMAFLQAKDDIIL